MRIDAMVAAGALCLSTVTMILVAPAAHGDDVLTTVTPAPSDGVGLLRRIGDQLVRGDNMTGAGVKAPQHVAEYEHPAAQC